MAITPNGRTVYAGYGTAIILIRAATNKAGKPIKLSWEADLMAMAITANGKTIYCGPHPGRHGLNAIRVGVLPMAIAIAP